MVIASCEGFGFWCGSDDAWISSSLTEPDTPFTLSVDNLSKYFKGRSDKEKAAGVM